MPPIQALLNWLYIFIDTTNPMAVMNLQTNGCYGSPQVAVRGGGNGRLNSDCLTLPAGVAETLA